MNVNLSPSPEFDGPITHPFFSPENIMSKKPSSFRINQITLAARALAVAAGLAAPGLALAQLGFSDAPPVGGTSTGGVMPNIVLTIDNSASMSENDATFGGVNMRRIDALRQALVTAFSDPAIVGDLDTPGGQKFRLAFQSMWRDAGFGPNRGWPTAGIDNTMKVFDRAHQTQLINWANTNFTAANGSRGYNLGPATPSHWLIAYAGEYLRGRWVNLGPNTPDPYNDGNTVDPSRWNTLVPVPSVDNPWKLKPGDSSDHTDPLTCRRAYHIFMTDGLWNSNWVEAPPPVSVLTGDAGAAANYDSAAKTLPDSTAYNLGLPLYAGDNLPGDGWSGSTMSDYAFYYWANDLTGKGANQVDARMASPITDNLVVTRGTMTVTYTPYWNPQNDPATWQHMQTFTIGFGTDVRAGNPGAGVITTPVAFDTMFGGNFFTAYASGDSRWPTTGQNWSGNLQDLVHAAYNGRGRFFPATSQEALTNAFKSILLTATSQSGAIGGIASAGGSSTRVNSSTMAYTAGYAYDTSNTHSINGWSGELKAYTGNAVGSSASWTASVPSATPATRNIFTKGAGAPCLSPGGCATVGPALPVGGTPFTVAGLTADPSGITSADINAVRALPLGDIVNSQLVYVGKTTLVSLNQDFIKFASTVNAFPNTGTVYVGANDGMMHGFKAGNGTPANAGDGTERFAYVPRGLLDKLSVFKTTTTYDHKYWVDSGMFSGNAQLDTASYGIGTSSSNNPGHWATVLVGTLGAGGKGYFVLDVTKPDDIMGVTNLPKAVLLDTTDSTDANIGHQFSPPVADQFNVTLQPAQIVKLNTKDTKGEWAIIMGNGYNNASGKPVLLIQSLSKTGRPLVQIEASCTATPATACVTAGNGLSAPRPVDVDGNGTADFVYAGDLMGNLWKFDISSVDQGTNWKVAYGGDPMFKAVGPTGKPQPITTAPVAVAHPNGGMMVGFGTGRNLTDADRSDTELNSFYALYDTQEIKIGETTIDSAVTPPVKVSQVTLGTAPSVFCTASSGGGASRYDYSNCLYPRTTDKLHISTMLDDSNDWKLLSTFPTSGETIGNGSGATRRGWYFDIPELYNGNAAKVLANPVMLQDNVVHFFTENVMSATNSVGQNNGTESCDSAAVINDPIEAHNFFKLLDGAPVDNIILTIKGVRTPYGSGTGNQKNRFRLKPTFRSGPNDFVGVDGSKITYSPADPAGRRAGWRISR